MIQSRGKKELKIEVEHYQQLLAFACKRTDLGKAEFFE